MSDYQAVTKALSEGTDPAMLCATCPWDRNCITPPTMTSGEIDQAMVAAAERDELAAIAEPGRMPAATLITAFTLGGRDTALQACPVLAVRLRSADGRKIAERMRSMMQDWEDS